MGQWLSHYEQLAIFLENMVGGMVALKDGAAVVTL
jgi:hypothetical protein